MERIISGTFYEDNDGTIPISGVTYRITSFGSSPLAEGISDSNGNFGEHRIPVGEPSLIRAAGLPHENFVLKRYIRSQRISGLLI